MINNFFQNFNDSPYSFYFLVVDEFLDISLPQLENFHLIYAYKNQNISNLENPHFCLEEQGISLTEKNSGKLLSHPKVIDYIHQTTDKLQPVIIPFKPSAKIEHLCHQFNWINASVPHQLNRFLEDKNQFFNFCQKHNLPIIPSNIDNFTENNFLKYQQTFGSKLVIQSHFGWAGNSTFSANNWTDIQNSFSINTPVKFSPYLDGYSLTNNCCLTSSGLVQSPSALQYTGIKPLTQNPFATVGRQWPSMAPANITKQVKEISQKFSQAISKLNYLGFFGLDFLVSDNKVYLLECNPRLTASFAFYTQIEINANLFPLFLLHLAQFIKITNLPDTNTLQKNLDSANLVGSEITQKSGSKTINKYQEFNSLSPQTNPITIPQNILDRFYV